MQDPADAIRMARLRILIVCADILAGNTGIVTGARKIDNLRHDLDLDDDYRDPDISIFMLISDELDRYPVGVDALRIAPQLQAEMDEAVKEVEGLYATLAKDACRNLIRRYLVAGDA